MSWEPRSGRRWSGSTSGASAPEETTGARSGASTSRRGVAHGQRSAERGAEGAEGAPGADAAHAENACGG
eukprot:2710142-Pleurochrysis_carterae.AAC.1